MPLSLCDSKYINYLHRNLPFLLLLDPYHSSQISQIINPHYYPPQTLKHGKVKPYPRQPISNPTQLANQPLISPTQSTTTTNTTDTGLPTSWEVRHSNSKNLPYYFNASTKESRWEPPPGTDAEKLKTYMAQHHSAPANPSLSLLSSSGGGAGSRDGKIRAAHLLVKHRDSRRPSSWKEPEIRRSKEEAVDILRGYEGRIKSGEISLGDLATSESDCTSARKKGDLSEFPLSFFSPFFFL